MGDVGEKLIMEMLMGDVGDVDEKLTMEKERADLGDAEDNLLWKPQNVQVLFNIIIIQYLKVISVWNSYLQGYFSFQKFKRKMIDMSNSNENTLLGNLVFSNEDI